MKSLIKETLYNSTAQAIIKILETPSFLLKVFLLACVIFSTGLCSWLIVKLILDYLTFNVTTKSRVLNEMPAKFPKITICNQNPFTTEYALEFLKKTNRKFYPKFDIFNETQMNELNFPTKIYLINRIKIKAKLEMNGLLNETEKRKLSRPIEDLLLFCEFPGHPCSAKNFTWYFDPWYGNCWQFNTGKNETLKYVSYSGANYGFNMYFYVNFYENLTRFNSYTGALGALIRIHNNSYLTNYQFDGILIESGHKTSISMSRSFKTILPRPFSDCLIDNETNSNFHSDLFDMIQSSPYRYTQTFCFWQCTQKTIIQECNCSDSTRISLYSNVPKCVSSDELECMIKVHDNKLYASDFFEKNCLKECPLECYLDEFDFSLSFAELIPLGIMDFLSSNHSKVSTDVVTSKIDSDIARKSFVFFNIFYKSLSYEMSLESPQIDLSLLFIGFGSYLSLFLGVSVFSLFEPIEVLIEVFFMKNKIKSIKN